jgi:hypothetical protein
MLFFPDSIKKLNVCSNPFGIGTKEIISGRISMEIDFSFTFTRRWDANTYKHAIKLIIE